MPYKTNEEISQYLAPYATYGQGWGGQNFLSSYQNAAAQRRALKQLYGDQEHDENYNLFNSALKGQQGSALAGGIVTGLTGLTTLAAGAQQASHINDTSMVEGQIDDLSRAGNYNYNNFAQLSNDYAQTNLIPEINYEDIRGMSKGQQVGNVATSALTGASAGLQIGGPIGAAVGGALGLGAGLYGVLSGNRKAQDKADYLKASALVAQEAAQTNFESAHERIREENNRRGAINVVANGGQINRRQMSMKEFSDRVLTKKGTPANKIIRTKGEGGTVIRIRVK